MIPPKKLLTVAIIFCAQIVQAQVGIGTTSPEATLHVVGSFKVENSGSEPALEIIPQANPTGSTTGQLAVIGDLLYMYDATRAKWLSVESSALQFGRNGNTNSQVLEFGGGMQSGSSGPIMPFNGTIIGITANTSGGASTKEFQVRVRNSSGTQSSINFNLISNTYSDIDTNNNFSAGDYLTVRARDNGDGNVSNPGVVVWVKWRK